ncbi:MAG: hypothetical protein KDJ41_02955 [Hyphomicrobiaceae bacterium]|nr:hypothetical protein [Hyphomicrobiaceae bacterium]
MPSKGARGFVAFIFIVLGLSFIATTATLFYEFGFKTALDLAAFDSQLFWFFPIFGVLALFAFYLPSAVFTDMYWRYVQPLGRVRFIFGFFVVIALTAAVTVVMLHVSTRSAWEIAPKRLASDRGQPSGCWKRGPDKGAGCTAGPVLDVVLATRAASESRVGLARFVRDCDPDPLLETSEENSKLRHCFPANKALNAKQCCDAQFRFRSSVQDLYAQAANRSLTYRVHVMLLPLKIFFLLVVVIIGLMLAFWRKKVDTHYEPIIKQLERGVLVGAFAMLFWPLTFHANLQSWSVLYGSTPGGSDAIFVPFTGMSWAMEPIVRKYAALALSLSFGPWALLLLFFFFRKKDIEATVRTAGVILSGLAVLKFDDLIDLSNRFLGSGSGYSSFLAMLLIFIGGLYLLARSRRLKIVAPEVPSSVKTPG